MMTKDEALKMAIYALEQQAQEPLTRAQQIIRANNTTQPTQEPVGWLDPKQNINECFITHELKREVGMTSTFYCVSCNKIRNIEFMINKNSRGKHICIDCKNKKNKPPNKYKASKFTEAYRGKDEIKLNRFIKMVTKYD